MNWSRWIRQLHRWLAVAFTVAVALNLGALGLDEYPAWVGVLALLPLWLLLFSGLYLFALPYLPARIRRAPLA